MGAPWVEAGGRTSSRWLAGAIVIVIAAAAALLIRHHPGWPASCVQQRHSRPRVLSPTRGPAGTTISLHGPSVGPNEGGEIVGDTRIEVSWNTDDWLDAGAGREPAAAGPGRVDLLGSQDLTGICTYDLIVTVPDVSPGTYPVTLVLHGGGGFSGYRAAIFRVTRT